MTTISYFSNASKFVATNTSFNTYISDADVLQYLQQYAATGAMHDSDERYPLPSCHPGTRKAVIDRIKTWYGYKEPPEESMMVVQAPAGYGKSAVAQFIADDFEQQGELDFNPLAGSFFFSRESPERNNPARFISTLAYQFATSIPEILPSIEDAVRRNPMILNKTLELQLQKLIIAPFRSVKGLDEMPNRLVIVDGLDECINLDRDPKVEKEYAQDQEHAQIRILDLIHTLQSHRFPLSFLIFTRPEPWIKSHIESVRFCDNVQPLDMYRTADNLKDVEMLFRWRLPTIGGSHSSSDGEVWPGEERLRKLVDKTRGDMMYATTIMLDLEDPYEDPQERLEFILDPSFDDGADLAHSSSFSFVYEHYRQILRSCPERNRPLMLDVLADLVVSHRLLSDSDLIPIEKGDISVALGVLDELSGRVRGRGIKSLRGLHSVIKLRPHHAGSSPIFHNGLFIRFLSRSKFSHEFAINTKSTTLRLLKACLKKLASVKQDTKVEDDHTLRFSIVAWSRYWSQWTPADGQEYSEILLLFVSIDLNACMVHAFSADSRNFCLVDLVHPNRAYPTPIQDISPHGSDQVLPDTMITFGKPQYPEHMELTAQCVSHLRAAFEAALIRLWDLPLRYSANQSYMFSEALVHYLTRQRKTELALDPVVQMLKNLRTSQPDRFGQLTSFQLGRIPNLDDLFIDD